MTAFPRTFLLAALLGAAAAGRVAGQTPETSGAFWPGADLHLQLAPNLRVLAFGESRTDQDYPYRQLDFGAGVGLQWWRFTQPHEVNLDPDKENYLVTAAGYEHLQTLQAGKDTLENRLAVEATPRLRLGQRLLLTDRNRVEFRWVDGAFSTRYRNLVAAELDAEVCGLRFTPYVSAEFFYDITTSAWKQEWYTAGLEIPYRRWLMVNAYYLRQECPGCTPADLNVFGLVLNFYVGSSR